MSLDQLLGEIPKADFVRDFYLKQPFSRQGAAEALAPLGSWETIGQAIADGNADMLVARQGQLWEGGQPDSLEEAQRLHGEGYTLVIRHVERHDPRLKALAEGFAADFRGVVNIHLYCTPGEQHGFGWHYDAEDVFIVQTSGRKDYALRKNTVNPWPLVETLPADMKFEREIMPVMKCQLAAGDWLYIPAGYWHVATAAEPALSLAIGVLPPAATDLFDALRPYVLDSIRWRQRLPIAGEAKVGGDEELQEAYQQLAEELAEDLRRQLTNPRFLRRFLEQEVEDRD